MADPDDLATKQAFLAALEKVRYSGQLSVQFGDRRIQYQSGADLRQAIADLRADIAALNPSVPPRRRTYRVSQSGNGY